MYLIIGILAGILLLFIIFRFIIFIKTPNYDVYDVDYLGYPDEHDLFKDM